MMNLMTGDSKKVYEKIFKKFTSLEELCDHYLGKGEWNKEYLYSEASQAFCDFAREHCPLLGYGDFWIEEPDSDEDEKEVSLWCIFQNYSREKIKDSMQTLARKTKSLTAFEVEWELEEEEDYVYITFKV